MNNEIENEFARLSPDHQLSEMAADPQVQREIEFFNADTQITEADGLKGD